MRRHLFLTLALGLSLGACGKQEPVIVNAYGVEKGAGSVGVHTVLAGDTVYKIAENYQLPMREIITLNHIQAPYVLNAGFRMKLPPPNEHEVKEGDTVSMIARMYETSPNRLASLNNLRTPYRLRAGQKLRLTPPMAEPKAVAQKAVMAQPEPTARLQGVERQAVQRSGASKPHVNKGVTPQQKPTLQKPTMQKASATRAQVRPKIPKQTPKMSGNGKVGGRFMRPVDGRIISNYGPKAGGLHNDGINIKAVRGSPVRAAENGIVVYTGDDLEGYGNLILIRHENKMMSAYAHLDKTLIKRGAKVTRGQSIGTVGSTGQVDNPQLHFEIRRGSKPLNPVKYL